MSDDENTSSFSFVSVSTEAAASIQTENLSTTQNPDFDDFTSSSSDQEPDGEAKSSCSTSLTPSVFEYEFAFGRRYHGYKSGKYLLPNDSVEQDREETLHALFLELFDGVLFRSNIGRHPHKIIDIGTGTGSWAIDVADLYPSASVIGTDLSPIQPNWLPNNLRMFIEDCEDQEWLHGSGFDLVHLRSMAGITRNFAALLAKAFPHVKEGGWIEIQDFLPKIQCDDHTRQENDIVTDFLELTIRGFRATGCAPPSIASVKQALQEAGFVRIDHVAKKVPIGIWPRDKKLKTIGLMMKSASLEAVDALASKPFAAMAIESEERETWVKKVREGLSNDSVHRYAIYCVWTARKITKKR